MRRTFALLMRFAFPAALLSCSGDSFVPPPTDGTGPVVEVLFPGAALYDEDGDSLVDLRVRWRDEAGLVDVGGVAVRSLTGVNGAVGAGNLVPGWRVERMDSAGMVLHETIDNLLRGGAHQLEIAVPDTSGNVTRDTLSLDLPHGVLYKTIVTGRRSAISHGISMVVCADDRRAYMTAGRELAIVDADSLRLIAMSLDPSAGDDLQNLLCIDGDPVLYVTERVQRFDRPSMQWLPRVAGSFGSQGIAQSRADPNILFVGETNSGAIGIIDRAQNLRIGRVPYPFHPSEEEYLFDLVALSNDTKIYASRLVDGGVAAIDPRTGATLAEIAVGGPTWPDLGRTDAFVLSRDERRLYAAVLDGDPRGVVEIDTGTDRVLRTLNLEDFVPQEIALSPNERRMFVTVQERFPGLPSYNVLIDVPNWRVIQYFPRPTPPGQVRFDGGVAFHPNGKLIFVGHNLDVDVYLSRE